MSDWVGQPGVDAADTVLGFNTGLALACLQLLHMWAVMERITTTHPLFVALAELGVRDSVISRKLQLVHMQSPASTGARFWSEVLMESGALCIKV